MEKFLKLFRATLISFIPWHSCDDIAFSMEITLMTFGNTIHYCYSLFDVLFSFIISHHSIGKTEKKNSLLLSSIHFDYNQKKRFLMTIGGDLLVRALLFIPFVDVLLTDLLPHCCYSMIDVSVPFVALFLMSFALPELYCSVPVTGRSCPVLLCCSVERVPIRVIRSFNALGASCFCSFVVRPVLLLMTLPRCLFVRLGTLGNCLFNYCIPLHFCVHSIHSVVFSHSTLFSTIHLFSVHVMTGKRHSIHLLLCIPKVFSFSFSYIVLFFICCYCWFGIHCSVIAFWCCWSYHFDILEKNIRPIRDVVVPY